MLRPYEGVDGLGNRFCQFPFKLKGSFSPHQRPFHIMGLHPLQAIEIRLDDPCHPLIRRIPIGRQANRPPDDHQLPIDPRTLGQGGVVQSFAMFARRLPKIILAQIAAKTGLGRHVRHLKRRVAPP